MDIGELLETDSPAGFADWLTEHGATAREIWVVLYKKGSRKRTVTYEQLVEVALCHGWIDGLRKSLDDERFVQRFSPRRKRSNWTDLNRQRALRLIAEGRMTPAGRAAFPAAMRDADSEQRAD